MKLLLVDDEENVLLFLTKLIKKNIFEINEIITASNGIEGMNCFLTNSIDIIITDISMPVMDGIEFIKLVRKHDKNIKIIILTAYSDFNYAKQAIDLNIKGYILKPVDDKYFKEIMIETISDVIQNTKEINFKEISLKLAKERILRKLLFLPKIDFKTEEIIREFNISFDNNPYALVLIKGANETYSEYIFSDSGAAQFENTITEIINTITRKYYLFNNSLNEWILILYDKIEYSMLKKMIFDLIMKINRITNTRFAAFISSFYITLNELHKAYNEAVEISDLLFFLHNEIVFSSDIIKYKININDNILPETDSYFASIQTNNTEQVFKNIDNIFMNLKTILNKKNIVVSFIFELLIKTKKIIQEKNIELLSHDDIFKISLNELCDLKNIDGIKIYFYNFIQTVFDLIKNQKNISKSFVIEKGKEYIEANYNKNIKLSDISSYAAVSKNYFCSQFKKSTELSIWDYVTEVRIEKAKNYIINTDLKIYDIAEKVGYENPSYFCNVFKRIAGETPLEYRSKNK